MSETTEPVSSGQSTTPAKMGRPTIYNDELAAELMFYLSQGMSLRTACSQDGMPHPSQVFRWLSASNTEPWAADFREQYARAKEEASDAMAEDILDIADDGRNDWIERQRSDGSTFEVVNSEVLQRSRLRVDTRKWLMAKMKPKRYGERVDVTTGGDKINRSIDIDEIDAALARYEASKKD